jgi:hypothetical protein
VERLSSTSYGDVDADVGVVIGVDAAAVDDEFDTEVDHVHADAGVAVDADGGFAFDDADGAEGDDEHNYAPAY